MLAGDEGAGQLTANILRLPRSQGKKIVLDLLHKSQRAGRACLKLVRARTAWKRELAPAEQPRWRLAWALNPFGNTGGPRGVTRDGGEACPRKPQRLRSFR